MNNGHFDLERFLEKSRDDSIAEHQYEEVNEHGFMTYDLLPDEGVFLIVQCCGDGAYWDRRAEQLAHEAGMRALRFATRRPPHGFERKFGYRVVGYVMEKEVSGHG